MRHFRLFAVVVLSALLGQAMADISHSYDRGATVVGYQTAAEARAAAVAAMLALPENHNTGSSSTMNVLVNTTQFGNGNPVVWNAGMDYLRSGREFDTTAVPSGSFGILKMFISTANNDTGTPTFPFILAGTGISIDSPLLGTGFQFARPIPLNTGGMTYIEWTSPTLSTEAYFKPNPVPGANSTFFRMTCGPVDLDIIQPPDGFIQEATNPVHNGTNDKDESDRCNVATGNGADSHCTKTCDPPESPAVAVDPQDPGDPVLLHSGEVALRRVDLRIPGRGLDWEFARRYRSRIQYNGVLGHNWTHNYDAKLVVHAGAQGGHIFLLDGNGRMEFYRKVTTNVYASPDGSYNTFRVVVNNPQGSEFELINRHGTRTRFRRDGSAVPPPQGTVMRMTQIADRNGNTLRFLYEDGANPNRLTAVLDTYGRRIEYLYTNGKLTTVRDFQGREIVLTYDANGDLESVRSPVVTGTPHGNDFPAGRTERYTYSSGFSDARLNHNLLTVTAPNDPIGTPRVAFQYQNTAGHPDYDRAISQTLGGTNASGVPAGGTIQYAYATLSNLPGVPWTRTTVTDRNANLTEYDFDFEGRPMIVREFTRGHHPGEPSSYETRYAYNTDGEILSVTHPEGNVDTYTYDSANPVRALQGNLLSVTRTPGPRGGDQASLVRNYTYEPIYNRLRTMTDERGYVTSHIFDYQEGANEAHLAAATGLPLTEIQNRLTGASIPMNLGDQNGDGVTTDPLNVCGNTVRMDHPTVTLPAGSPLIAVEGPTQERVETRIYNTFGQTTSVTDPEENVTLSSYYPETDPDGDGLNPLTTNGAGQPSNPTTGGYLKQTTRDGALTTRALASDIGRNSAQLPALTSIKTDLFYDRVGHVTAVLDGRGIRTEFLVTALDETIQVKRAASVAGVPARLGGAGGAAEDLTGQDYAYLEQVYYDANGNVIRRDVENRDGNTPDAGLRTGWIESRFQYDILDDLLEERREIAPGVEAVTTHRYDFNQNRILTTFPEGNQEARTWDERDLPLALTRGFLTPESATVSFERYDGNRNLLKFRDAEDHNGDLLGDPVTRTYDGYDRVTTVRDAVGSVTERHYDPASNLVQEKRHGTVGGASPPDDSGAGNTLLSEKLFVYDEAGRAFRTDQRLFLPAGVAPTRPVTLQDGPLTPGDLLVSARFDFDRLSRLRFSTDDDLHETRQDYDGAGRVLARIDAEANEIRLDYDDNGNPVRETCVERHPEAVVPDESFVSLASFDSLDRRTRLVTNLGHAHRAGYDSRDLPVLLTDAEAGPSSEQVTTTQLVTLNLPGRPTVLFHDGLGRLVKAERPVTANPANPDGFVTLLQGWDLNSRLLNRTDDRGNLTAYAYDALDRRTRETTADARFTAYGLDKDGNVRTLTDPNGSVRTCTHDAVNRLVSCAIQRGGGVVGTTLQAFEYDGLNRTTRAFDNNDPNTPADDSVVSLFWESLSRQLEEHQVLNGNTKIVSWDWEAAHHRVSQTYPNDRQTTFTFDHLDRLKTVTNAAGAPLLGQVAAYEYMGPNRLLKRSAQNGTVATLANDLGTLATGYDGDQRVIELRHRQGSTLLAGFQYTHDRMDNRLTEVRPHMPATKQSDGFDYDELYRLVSQRRDIPQGGGIPAEARSWELDGAGNWNTLTVTPNGGAPQVFNQAMDVLNSYTSFGGVAQVDDLAGNRVRDGEYKYTWDFLNRLKELRRSSDGAVVATYLYDAYGANSHLNGAGRRILKQTYPLPVPPQMPTTDAVLAVPIKTQTRFLYDGVRVIEERNASDRVTQQHVDGGWLDEHLTMDVYQSNGTSLLRTLFYHENSQGWIHALTDAAGAVVERYGYDAYGQPTILTPAGNPSGTQGRSAYGNPYFREGYNDAESGLKLAWVRHRVMHHGQGRWLSRDPIGIWEDDGNSGNAYCYGWSNPISRRDPRGLDVWVETTPGSAHQQLTIGRRDKPDEQRSFSFGAVSYFFLMGGEVYEAVPGGEIDPNRYLETSDEMDAKLIKQLEAFEAKKIRAPYLLLALNCRSWSQANFDALADHLEETGRGKRIHPGETNNPGQMEDGSSSSSSYRGAATSSESSSKSSKMTTKTGDALAQAANR